MENKENTGAIFKNVHKKTEKHPDYKGSINVDGIEKDISLWINTSKAGTKYMSAVINKPYVPLQEDRSSNVEPEDMPF
tara:strand:- start:152 stop:385 length:234 start_codon:yes stop_codon:yes gene_type:complete